MSYRILFIDHDPDRAEQFRESLEKDGHELQPVQEADRAVRELEETRPDLVVIDSTMTDPPVADLCRQLKETTPGAETPVVVLTGEYESEENSVAQLAQSGCDLLVEKPVTVERLIGICRELRGDEPTTEDDPAESDEVSSPAEDDAAVEARADAPESWDVDSQEPPGATTAGDPEETGSPEDEVVTDSESDSAPEEPVAADAEGREPAPGDDPDGLLDPEAVQSAMGNLDSIVDESGDATDSEEAAARARASARGDFSELLGEINVDHPPSAPIPSGETTSSEPAGGAETADDAGVGAELESAVMKAFDGPRSGDEGQDIEAHLDTLFAGGGEQADSATAESKAEAAPATSVETESPAPAATTPAPFDEASKKSTQPMAIVPQPVEPEVEPPEVTNLTPEAPPAAETVVTPEFVSPMPSPVEAPRAHELFDPPEATPPPIVERPRTGKKGWLIAAVVALVAVGGAALLFLRGGAEPASELGEPVVADAASFATAPPVLGTDSVPSGGEAAAGLPIGTTRPDSEGSDEPAGSDRTGETPAATRAAPEKTAPAKPRPRETGSTEQTRSAPPAGTTRPKPVEPQAKTESKRTETAVTPVPKPAKTVASTSGSSASATPKPAEPAPVAPAKPQTDKSEAPTKAVSGTTVGAVATASEATSRAVPDPATAPVTEPITETVTEPAADAATSKSEPTPAAPDDRTSFPELSVAPAPEVAGSQPSAANTASPDAAAGSPDTREPIVKTRVEPELSPKALKQGKRGTVVLKVLVNEQGTISRVLVERGIPGSDLEAAAISAVLRWTFEPATRRGEPVRAWTKATFEFGK